MSFPLLSATVTGRTTKRVSARNVGVSSEAVDGFCAKAMKGIMAANNQELLCRRIITKAEERFKRRQTSRLDQFDIHMPIFAVPLLILWSVVQHILVAKLYTNFSRYVR